MKLEKTMTEFVLEQDKIRIMNFINESTIVAYEKILQYANFINQELNIGMFVPCDDEGNVLKEPFKCSCAGYIKYCTGCEFTDIKHKKAKEKVLFKGFELRKGDFERILIHDKQNKAVGTFINNKFRFFPAFKTIENLIPLKLELTETAKNLLK